MIVAQFWPNISNVILSRNVSQSHHLLFITEYFIDQEKYFYLIMLHIYIAICIGLTTMVSTGTTIIAYLQYTCGLFKISRYKIIQGYNNFYYKKLMLYISYKFKNKTYLAMTIK